MAHSSEMQAGSMAATTQTTMSMRSSPPIQPGETEAKLPSFSEFLNKTRADTPPRTPQRSNGSANSSPHARPHFEDVSWQERKRRLDDRNDTLGDIYAPHKRSNYSAEPATADPRRINSVVEPSMHYLSTQHEAAIDPGYAYRRRQSSSYHAPLRHSSVGPHIRHQSPPVPQGHVAYRQPPAHPSSAVYTQPAPPSGPIYEHRRSYYQEAPPVGNAYGYGRPQESYYARPAYGGPAHPVYDNGYGDNIRFHQNVGPDHNAFNRKRRGNLPKEATNMFKAWFQDNKVSPYPTEEQKLEMAQITGLTVSQISNWFINARRRAPGKEARDKQAAEASKRPEA